MSITYRDAGIDYKGGGVIFAIYAFPNVQTPYCMFPSVWFQFRYPSQDNAIGRYKCTLGGIDNKYTVLDAAVETKVEATA